uniref:Uncharacterized protein n=1 Tax=Romanomermis culicivorax TaxID=13658 RepID=A0A915J7E3_ROMCU
MTKISTVIDIVRTQLFTVDIFNRKIDTETFEEKQTIDQAISEIRSTNESVRSFKMSKMKRLDDWALT